MKILTSPKSSAAPGGVHRTASNNDERTPALQIVAPGKPSRKSPPYIPTDEDLDLDTPLIVPQRSVTQCYGSTVEQCEIEIEKSLLASETHRKQSAIWDLRTGVLFQIYRQALGIKGRKTRVGFWERAEKRFGVSRQTISRKMRLAAIWAKKQGASEEQIRELAEAANLEDTSIPAVQLAFDWIGDKTTTDLYRENKLVYTEMGGYRETRKDGSPRAPRRTNMQIERENFEIAAQCANHKLRRALIDALTIRGPEGARSWDILNDAALEELKLAAYDLHQGCLASEGRRKSLMRGKR